MDIEDSKSPAVSAHDRELANSKSITLQPLHDEVTPEAPDSFELTAERANSAVLANAPNDTEETIAVMQPPVLNSLPKTHIKASTIGVVGGSIVGVAIVVMVIAFIIR